MNRFKSLVLIVAMSALLMLIGDVFYGQQGLVMALGIGILLNGVSYFFSDRIVLKAYRAKIITSSDDPQLFEMVQNLARRARLPMPRIAIIPDDSPNAFATGRNPERAVVAVTEGIRRLMNREELEAVLAHELGHVNHRDILVGSIAAVLAQAIMFISRMAMWFGGSRDQEGRSASPAGAIAVMILGPVAAMMLQMALSRSREFMADEFSATVTGRPDMLASALEKLENFNQRVPMMDAEPATAHMMIVNPLSGGGLMSLFSTHPPVKERIKRLRAMKIRG